jgi:acetylornithine deacetylase/succinyl-diaminopimelate desuccinylase-like protein
MTFRRVSVCCLLVSCAAPAAPGPATVDPVPVRRDIGEQAVALLQAYLRIDTTNPPGNEMRTARFLKRVLDREGIESEIFDLGSGRANLRAVLRGDGRGRPVVLLHHMDVVGAEPRFWRVPPFSGALVRGEIWGRGAVDMKGKAIIDLAAMIQLKRQRVRLRRDLVLLAVADEEVDSAGTRWVVERRPDLVRGAEILIDEGTGITLDAKGRTTAYQVSIGEKAPLWLSLTFTGHPGHGSAPIDASAVNRAIRAAARLLDHPRPPRLLPELRAWVKLQLAGRDLSALPGFEGDLEAALDRPAFLEALARDEDLGPALRDTVSITVLRGSDKVNVIPNEAELQLDCRLLPGTEPRRFLAELRQVMNDPGVRIRVLVQGQPRLSPADGPFVRALRAVAARRDPGVPVVPTILQSSTDSAYFRTLGIQAYGFEPYRLTDEQASLSHSNDERLSARNVREGVQLLLELLRELNR